MKKIINANILALGLSLCGCDGEPDKISAFVSKDLSEECVENLLEADTWLIQTLELQNDIPHLLTYTVLDDLEIRKIGYREVYFSSSFEEGSQLTTTKRYGFKRILKNAKIQLQNCDVQAITHELAHLFGLSDINKPGRLMHETYDPENIELTFKEKQILVENILTNK